MQIFKNPNKQADDIIEELITKYEAGKFGADGQVDDSLAKMFDNEDDAFDFATNNDYDYITGYTYKPGKEEPSSSFDVWNKGVK